MFSFSIPLVIMIAGALISVVGVLRVISNVKDGLVTLMFGLAIVAITSATEISAGRNPLNLLTEFNKTEIHSEELNNRKAEKARLIAMQKELNQRKKSIDRKDPQAVADFETSVQALEARYQQYKSKYGDNDQ